MVTCQITASSNCSKAIAHGDSLEVLGSIIMDILISFKHFLSVLWGLMITDDVCRTGMWICIVCIAKMMKIINGYMYDKLITISKQDFVKLKVIYTVLKSKLNISYLSR